MIKLNVDGSLDDVYKNLSNFNYIVYDILSHKEKIKKHHLENQLENHLKKLPKRIKNQ